MQRVGGEEVIEVAVSTSLIWEISKRVDELSDIRAASTDLGLLDGRVRSRSPEPRRSAFASVKEEPPQIYGDRNALNTQSGTVFVTTEDVVHALKVSKESAPQLSLAGKKELLFEGESEELLLSSEKYFRSMTQQSGCLPHFVGQSLDEHITRQVLLGDQDYPNCSSIWLYYCCPTVLLMASEFWYSGRFDASLTLPDCKQYQNPQEQPFLLSFHFHARGAINHLLNQMARGRVRKDFWQHPCYRRSASIVCVPVCRDFLLGQLSKIDDNGNYVAQLWHESHLEAMVGISSERFQVSRWSLENLAHFIADVDLREMVEDWWSSVHSEALFLTGHVLYHVGLHHFKTHLLRGDDYCSAFDKQLWKRRTAGRHPAESIARLRNMYQMESRTRYFILLFVCEDGYFALQLCDMMEAAKEPASDPEIDWWEENAEEEVSPLFIDDQEIESDYEI